MTSLFTRASALPAVISLIGHESALVPFCTSPYPYLVLSPYHCLVVLSYRLVDTMFLIVLSTCVI
jgi:hypothetical protein